MHNHEAAECPLRVVPCPIPECSTTLPFLEMRKHVAEQHKDSRQDLDEMLVGNLVHSMGGLWIELDLMEPIPAGKAGHDFLRDRFISTAREKLHVPTFLIDAYEDTQ